MPTPDKPHVNYFRIAVRSASENQQLLAGLAQIIAKQEKP
jgi:histidinol-phosphate/aromatic aminotransferase/cobyric acid decarboxylase-like protein